MAVDLTRDDLARLRHGKHVAETHGSMDSERAYWRDLAECADALLVAAERDLERREGLVFGPEYADVRHAVAAEALDLLAEIAKSNSGAIADARARLRRGTTLVGPAPVLITDDHLARLLALVEGR